MRDIDQARAQSLITEAEAEQLRAAADAVAAAIAVDDFAPEELARRKASPTKLTPLPSPKEAADAATHVGAE